MKLGNTWSSVYSNLIYRFQDNLSRQFLHIAIMAGLVSQFLMDVVDFFAGELGKVKVKGRGAETKGLNRWGVVGWAE